MIKELMEDNTYAHSLSIEAKLNRRSASTIRFYFDQYKRGQYGKELAIENIIRIG